MKRCNSCGHWPEEHDWQGSNGCAGCDAMGYELETIIHKYVPCTQHEDCEA